MPKDRRAISHGERRSITASGSIKVSSSAALAAVRHTPSKLAMRVRARVVMAC